MTRPQARLTPPGRSCCTEPAYTHAWLMGLCASPDLARLDVLVETRSDDGDRLAMILLREEPSADPDLRPSH